MSFSASITAPAVKTTAPARVSRSSDLSGVAASRIAAIGGTRAARSAGISAAATVNTTPTSRVTITT